MTSFPGEFKERSATRTQTQWDGHEPITVQTERRLWEGSRHHPTWCIYV